MPKTILIIREADEFSQILAANGFEVIDLPVVETRPLKDLSDFKDKLARIENYDGIFITSQHAARILVSRLREEKINFGGKIYVLGGKSFGILKNEKLGLIFVGAANTARELLEKIPLEDLHDRSFLFVRGTRSLRTVPDFLEKIAAVDEAIVYETVERKIEIDKIKPLREKFKANEIAAACFFSPSAAESFIKQFGAEILHQTIIAAIGKTTAEFFERRNLKVGFVSPKATAKDFAVGIVKFLEKRSL